MKGLITKGIASFYYVDTPEGVFRCKARGIFKKEDVTPYVGDYVEMDITDDVDDEGVINEILPRKNVFVRPPVSNIDMLVIVVALEDPEPNTEIIDKLLVIAEQAEVEALVVINKSDLKDEDPMELISIYEHLYPTMTVSAREKVGLEQLKALMKGKKSALAGPSGVGKSTVINAIDPRLDLETGDISRKTRRGKHTTRHVEIFETDFGAFVYDTPGFTSFEVKKDEDVRLDYLFPDFEDFRNKCRFSDCSHVNEPGCAVREAVQTGKISGSRYASYLKIGEEWNG